MKTALELLNNIKVASPCTARWDEMAGDDFVRFCGHCAKNVYNLSALSAAQAVALVREKEGDLCGRFFRRADGTVITGDCPVGVHHRIRRKRRLAAVAVSLAGFLTMGGGCARFDDSSGTTTADPPARQQQSDDGAKPAVKPRVKEDCIMGKIDVPVERGAGRAGEASENLSVPPRDTESESR